MNADVGRAHQAPCPHAHFPVVHGLILLLFSTRTAECPNDHYTCSSSGRCIATSLVCDENPDCVDGSDEINCSKFI